MPFLTGVAQVLAFLILLKVSHILYWNLRKSYFIHPWLLEAAVATALVMVFHFVSGVWGLILAVSVALGLIRGDREPKPQNARQLL